MINATILSDDNEKFRVRIQRKVNGEWIDHEIESAVGRSQRHGVEKGDTRLIVEDIHGIPLNVPREG